MSWHRFGSVAAGDLIEVTYEAELEGANNIDAIGMFAFLQSSGYAFICQCSHMVTNTANNSGNANPQKFCAVFRAMPFGSPSGAPCRHLSISASRPSSVKDWQLQPPLPARFASAGWA